MICSIFCEHFPQPMESCEGDEGDVCSCVVNYVCAWSLDLDGGLRCMDVFDLTTFLDVQG